MYAIKPPFHATVHMRFASRQIRVLEDSRSGDQIDQSGRDLDGEWFRVQRLTILSFWWAQDLLKQSPSLKSFVQSVELSEKSLSIFKCVINSKQNSPTAAFPERSKIFRSVASYLEANVCMQNNEMKTNARLCHRTESLPCWSRGLYESVLQQIDVFTPK